MSAITADNAVYRGTAFPTTGLYQGMPFDRTDLRRRGYYDLANSRWTSEPYEVQVHDYTAGAQPWAVAGERLVAGNFTDVKMYLLRWSVAMFVGTTNSGSNYVSVELRSLNSSIGFDSHATVDTHLDAPNSWLPVKETTSFTNNPVGLNDRWFQIFTTFTGSPGGYYILNRLRVCDILT